MQTQVTKTEVIYLQNNKFTLIALSKIHLYLLLHFFVDIFGVFSNAESQFNT